MKTKLLFILCLAFLNGLRAQTHVATSDTILCSGNSATLTAIHDFLHNWCYWSTGGSGNSIVVSPTVNTTYSVTCYDADADPAGTSFVQQVMICTGIKQELASAIIEIFPNPSTDLITVSGLEKNTSIEVSNALGGLAYKGVANDEIKQIDLSDYKPGIYFITIRSGKQEFTRKIIKQ